MRLSEGKIGGCYGIVEMHLPEETEKRLAALGMNPGTLLSVKNNKGNGTVIVKFRGTRLALGRAITRNILVRSMKWERA